MLKKLKATLKALVEHVLLCAIILFAAFNVYYAARYGLIYGGPRGHAHLLSFQQSPFYFSLAAICYAVVIIIFAPFIYFKVTGNPVLENALAKGREMKRIAEEIKKRDSKNM